MTLRVRGCSLALAALVSLTQCASVGDPGGVDDPGGETLRSGSALRTFGLLAGRGGLTGQIFRQAPTTATFGDLGLVNDGQDAITLRAAGVDSVDPSMEILGYILVPPFGPKKNNLFGTYPCEFPPPKAKFAWTRLSGSTINPGKRVVVGVGVRVTERLPRQEIHGLWIRYTVGTEPHVYEQRFPGYALAFEFNRQARDCR